MSTEELQKHVPFSVKPRFEDVISEDKKYNKMKFKLASIHLETWEYFLRFVEEREGVEEKERESESGEKNYAKSLGDFISENLEILMSETNEMFEEIDVTFEVGWQGLEKTKIHAIRGLFACQSPVFKAMLFGKMAEGLPNAIIPLDDITPKTMEYFQFIILWRTSSNWIA